MTADRLRQAARVLRERAEATSWSPECGGWWRPDDQPPWAAKVAEADIDVAECRFPPNADYIATVHPGVGLALADWLDKTADDLARHLPVWEAGIVRYPESWVGRTVESNVQHHYGHALRLADLILGGAS